MHTSRSLLRELAWLVGCWGMAWLATGAVLGFRDLSPLDIQLHNTYFILPAWGRLIPLFLAVAVPMTLVRAAQQQFGNRATNAVLTGLAVGWALLLVCLLWWLLGVYRWVELFG